MRAMQMLGVPYADADVDAAVQAAKSQAEGIAAKIVEQDSSLTGLQDKKAIALIAYLDRLGTDLFATPEASADQPTAESAE
jgi:cytochrome c oxidase cbb3-type subunit I/II